MRSVCEHVHDSVSTYSGCCHGDRYDVPKGGHAPVKEQFMQRCELVCYISTLRWVLTTQLVE